MAHPCPACGAARETPDGPCPACGGAGQTQAAGDAGEATLTRTRTETLPRASARGPGLDLRAGGALGRFRLIRPLGRGGFGEVWEAHDERDERRVAVKVLNHLSPTSIEERERFRREARLAASISHPRCAAVLSGEDVDQLPVIVMELVEGGTLQDRLRREGRLPFRQAVDAIVDVVEGLEAALACGVIHRDVKPSNCFVAADGRVKVGDFGLSKSFELRDELSRAGGFVGTPVYASPEQVRGETVDSRSDMYSVGATLFALLAGEPPFQGTSAQQVFARVLTEPAPALGARGVTVPPGLERVVGRLLEKEPAKRYESYRELHDALWPFGTRGAAPAGRGLALAAVLTDLWLAGLSSLVVGVAADLLDQRSPGMLGSTTLWVVVAWLAGAAVALPALEWRFGGTPGALLLGLRVGSASHGTLTPPRATLRGALLLLALLPILLADPGNPAAWGPLLLLLLPFGPGGTSLHEWLSGTRLLLSLARSLPRVPHEPAMANPSEGRRLGPFEVVGRFWRGDGQELLEARDPVLRRLVWIHVTGSPTRTPAQLAVARPGQLRWLQGGTSGALRWNAFEPPSGASFDAWVTARGRLAWRELAPFVRGLLADVEARLGGHEDERTAVHPWVSSDGSARLLDFAPPAAVDEPGVPIGEWRTLVRKVLFRGLEGRQDAERPLERLRAPLPRAVRDALGALDRGSAASPGELRILLEQAEPPDQGSLRHRRVSGALLGVVPTTLFAAAVTVAHWKRLLGWAMDLRQLDPASLMAIRLGQLIEHAGLFLVPLGALWSLAAWAAAGLTPVSARGALAPVLRPLARAGLLLLPVVGCAWWWTRRARWPEPLPPEPAIVLWALAGILYPLCLLAAANAVGPDGRTASDRAAGLHFVPRFSAAHRRRGTRLVRGAAIATVALFGLVGFELVALGVAPFVRERLALERAAIGGVTVSRETTHVTTPLGPDGLPDFVAWLNASKTLPDRDNAAAALLTGAREALASPERRLEEELRGLAPGTTPTPELEAWLQQNAGPLERLAEALAEARQRDRFWIPLEGATLFEGTVPSTRALRLASDALRARSALQLDRGERAGAVRDLERGLWLGRPFLLEPDAPLVYRLVGIGLSTLAVESIAAATPRLAAEDCRRLLPEVRAVVALPVLAREGDIGDRVATLDLILHARRLALRDGPRRWRGLAELVADAGVADRLATVPPWAIDWDHSLRTANRYYDLRSGFAAAGEDAEARRLGEELALFDSRLDSAAARLDVGRLRGGVDGLRSDRRALETVTEGFTRLLALPRLASWSRNRAELLARSQLAAVALAQRDRLLAQGEYHANVRALEEAAGAPPRLALGTRFVARYEVRGGGSTGRGAPGFRYVLELEDLAGSPDTSMCQAIDERGALEGPSCASP